MKSFNNYIKKLLIDKRLKNNNEQNQLPKQFNINDLPDLVLENIFQQLSSNDLIKNGVLVCKKWNRIINDDLFWLNRLVNQSKIDRNNAILLGQDSVGLKLKHIYLTNFFNYNLLKNPCGDEKFKHWYLTKPSRFNLEISDTKVFQKLIKEYKKNKKRKVRYTWCIEDDHHGTEALYDSNKNVLKNFVTTFFWGSKLQLIELNDSTYDSIIKKCISKNMNLKLEVCEFYASRFDSGCIYKLNVYLLNKDFEIVDYFRFEDILLQWSNPEWKLAKHEFKIEKPFRYIIFHHAGKDTQCWAGFYGSKMTNGSVKFILSN